MGIKKPEFDAEYESVEKLQKDSCKKLSARMWAKNGVFYLYLLVQKLVQMFSVYLTS